MNSTVDVPPQSDIDNGSHKEVADNRVYLQDECDTGNILHRRRRDLESCSFREKFTEEIKDAGLKRPDIYSYPESGVDEKLFALN